LYYIYNGYQIRTRTRGLIQPTHPARQRSVKAATHSAN